MAEYVANLRRVLQSLYYPLRESDLEKVFLTHIRDIPDSVKIEQISELTAAFEEAKEVNITHVRAVLHAVAPRILKKEWKRISSPVRFEHIQALRTRLEVQLNKEAEKYVKVTFDNATSVNTSRIAAVEIRVSIPEIISTSEDFAFFVTAEAVSNIYLRCQSELLSQTQSQISDIRDTGLLRPYIEDYYDRLLDLQRLNSVLEVKFIKRICKEHFKYVRQEVERIFHTEAKACVSGKPADWDIDPASPKGSCMLFVASIAQCLQPNKAFAQDCLQFVIAWDRYPTGIAASGPWEVLIECVSRLYIGLLRLQNVDERNKEVNVHPEVYLWMHRVLAKLYAYPRQTSYFENRFLNVMNHCVAKVLKERSAFHQNLRYVLGPEQRVPNSSHDARFLSKVKDGVEFRYLTDSSVASMLHISGIKGRDDLDTQMITTDLDLSGDILIWQGSKSKVIKRSLHSSCLVSIPVTLLAGWGMLAPLFTQAMAEFFLDNRSTLRKNLEKARCIGIFLGLLYVHGKIKNRFQSLFGLGIGAQIVLSCLAEVAEFNRKVPEEQRVYLLDVILFLGAAEVGEVDWDLVTEPVRGRFINIYSSHDAFFSSIIGPDMLQPIGFFGVLKDGIENRDMAEVLEIEKMISKSRGKTKALSMFKVISKLMDYYP